ncbi:MAG: LLM class flavin-dependent oxidoreductase [Firmicutes bacterium]|nr:LLM class flavin-dependent oxidoreductase [Bacillota bacterium]
MNRIADVLHGPFDPGGQPDTRSGNPLELGFFAWNLACGMTASKAVLSDPPRLRDFWHWDSAVHLNQLAERIGYEYQVPFARWRGHGGPSGYNDDALDFLASAAALVPVTSSLGLFSTVHVTYKFHPLHIAKMGATIDFISGGRWGLNVVTGGPNTRENRMFGQDPFDHDEAYDIADEFVTCMKWLWASDDPIDFVGRYYQSYGGIVRPKPRRHPRPILMNAGNSPKGLDFAARHCDWVFLTGRTLDEYRDHITQVRTLADRYRRVVRPATMVYVVMAETDARAQAIVDWLESEVDREAVWSFVANRDRRPGSSFVSRYGSEYDYNDPWFGLGREQFMRTAFGLGAWHLYGGYDTVAEQIRALHQVGIESILTCFYDPLRGLHQMEDDVIPRLRKMGLRR